MGESKATYVIFCVGIGVGKQEDATGFVVPVLAAQVERREAGPVHRVHVRPLAAQDQRRLRVAAPSGLVKCAIAVLLTSKRDNELEIKVIKHYENHWLNFFKRY